MTFEQFKYYLETYGASLRRWPPELRDAAQVFLDSSSAAIAARREAERLDGLLDRFQVAPAEGAERRVAHAVLAGARSLPPARPLELLFGASRVWPRAAALAFAAALGIVVGISQVERPFGDMGGSEFAQLQVDSPFEASGL